MLPHVYCICWQTCSCFQLHAQFDIWIWNESLCTQCFNLVLLEPGCGDQGRVWTMGRNSALALTARQSQLLIFLGVPLVLLHGGMWRGWFSVKGNLEDMTLIYSIFSSSLECGTKFQVLCMQIEMYSTSIVRPVQLATSTLSLSLHGWLKDRNTCLGQLSLHCIDYVVELTPPSQSHRVANLGHGLVVCLMSKGLFEFQPMRGSR